MSKPRKGPGAANPGHFAATTSGRDSVPTAVPVQTPQPAATPAAEPTMAQALAALTSPDVEQLRDDLRASTHDMRTAAYVIDLLDIDNDTLGYWVGRADAYDNIGRTALASPLLVETAAVDARQALGEAWVQLEFERASTVWEKLTAARFSAQTIAQVISAGRGLTADQQLILRHMLPAVAPVSSQSMDHLVTDILDEMALLDPGVRETFITLLRDGGWTYESAFAAASRV